MVRIHHHPVAERHQFHIAGWSSLEARRAHNPEVIGSNPIPATFAQLAQLVEQRTENPRVSGSIPELGILMPFYSLYIFIFLALCQMLGRDPSGARPNTVFGRI